MTQQTGHCEVSTVIKTLMMARITFLNMKHATAAADDLRAAGYEVEITDEFDPYSHAVFMRARCVSDDAHQVLDQVESIANRHRGFCDDAGPDDGTLELGELGRQQHIAKLEASQAYHEAGYVVAAYWAGGRLRYGGVRIGEHAQAGFRGELDVVRTLAGWVADAKKYNGDKGVVAYGEIRSHLRSHS